MKLSKICIVYYIYELFKIYTLMYTIQICICDITFQRKKKTKTNKHKKIQIEQVTVAKNAQETLDKLNNLAQITVTC